MDVVVNLAFNRDGMSKLPKAGKTSATRLRPLEQCLQQASCWW